MKSVTRECLGSVFNSCSPPAPRCPVCCRPAMVTTLSLFLLATATTAPVFDVLPARRKVEVDWRPGRGELQLDTARQLGVDRRDQLETVRQLVVERREELAREEQLLRERREQLDTVLQLLKNPMVHQITNKHYGV